MRLALMYNVSETRMFRKPIVDLRQAQQRCKPPRWKDTMHAHSTQHCVDCDQLRLRCSTASTRSRVFSNQVGNSASIHSTHSKTLCATTDAVTAAAAFTCSCYSLSPTSPCLRLRTTRSARTPVLPLYYTWPPQRPDTQPTVDDYSFIHCTDHRVPAMPTAVWATSAAVQIGHAEPTTRQRKAGKCSPRCCTRCTLRPPIRRGWQPKTSSSTPNARAAHQAHPAAPYTYANA